jgi:hypothetical protein
VRTCVGCRQEDDREALLRFVLAGDPPTFVPDVSRRASGRGVSVHPTRRCIDAAVRTGALRRGLRAQTLQAAPTASDLAGWASGQYVRRIDGLLVAAFRANHAALGTDAVGIAIANRRAALLVVAGDATENRQELMASAERLGASCMVHADKARLGHLFGRETLAVIAITDLDLASELQRAARCAALLAETP